MAVILSTDQDFGTLLTDHEKVIVKDYADWCGSCKLFAPKFRRISEEEAYAGITFLDVNAEENPEARKAAGVDNLPFFATFKNGQLLKASSGSKEEFVKGLLDELKNA